MPLYMDFHELDEFSEETVDQLKQGHLLDLAVQARYNVAYKHYYVSKENRKAFCVMEGPDKESCEAVHREAHGLVACNIVEVELSKYGHIMGPDFFDPDGLHLHENGEIDSGTRTILLISSLISVANGQSGSVELSKYYPDYSNSLTETVLRYGGRPYVNGKHENLYAFNSSANAVQCSLLLKERISQLNHTLREKSIKFETTTVLNAGEPVTRNPEFFGDTLQLARRLSHTGKDGDIIVSSGVNHLTHPTGTHPQSKEVIRMTSVEDERFINRVMDVLERKMKNEKFNVVELSEHVGISRPHLYRKIQHLFGRSPNHLINEIRLREAVKLLQKRFGNISEIAYEVGYNNPSYFSKCFQKRFGILPSGYKV